MRGTSLVPASIYFARRKDMNGVIEVAFVLGLMIGIAV